MPSFKVGESSASRVPVDWQPPASATADQCPVDHRTREKWLSAASPPSAPHPLHHSLPTPSPNPSAAGPSRPAASRLGTDRVISSIPRGSVPLPSSESLHAPSAPDHGPPVEAADDGGTAQGKWVYPSEQQFFNAMMRKNHNPQQQDMRTVVPIHNAVNEKAWEEVLLWESGTGSEKCGGPRLVSFSGRPQDRTPKAWLNVALGYQPPFDRHDWYVDRCGKLQRYVLDFYTGKSDPNQPHMMNFYIDVRPALDNWQGIETRLRGWMREWGL